MLKRKAMDRMLRWKNNQVSSRALLIEGARQVGKTYLVRQFGKQYYRHFAEINFLENVDACKAVSSASNAEELFFLISTFVEGDMVEGSTLVFLDEVQETLNVVTAIKFLVDKYPGYDWVLSGSLLGVEMANVKSAPVGYLDSIRMYPLDFQEYCWARGLANSVIDAARDAFAAQTPMDEFVNKRMLGLYHEYLMVGGMPQAVETFAQTQNIQDVRDVQNGIIFNYRNDISKYAKGRERIIKRIFDLMPSELSDQNKRFVISDVDGTPRIDRYENDFMWLADAGVALPVYNVHEPRPPLLISQKSTLFKFFMSDVGLLACLCGMDVTREFLAGRRNILYGAIYENAAAQELIAHGFSLYYFKSKTVGEIDFLVEHPTSTVLPIEIKSGLSFRRHKALDKLLEIKNYGIEQGIVFCEGNFEVNGKVLYAPVYSIMFLEKSQTIL